MSLSNNSVGLYAPVRVNPHTVYGKVTIHILIFPLLKNAVTNTDHVLMLELQIADIMKGEKVCVNSVVRSVELIVNKTI